jgi:PAS domain S-box-containing protein
MLKKRRFDGKPYFVLAISLCLTLIASAFSYWYSSQRARLAFEDMANDEQARLSETMAQRITLVRGFAGIFTSGSGVTDEDFHRYAAATQLASYPDVRSIGYIERVKGANGDMYPITHVAPSNSTTTHTLGMNLLSDAALRPMFEAARDTGLPAISGRTNRLSEEPVFLICVASYKPGASLQGIDDRRRSFDGFVFASIRPDQLFESTGGANVRIFNGGSIDPSHLLYSGATADNARTLFTTRRAINMPGTPLTLMFTTPSWTDIANRAWAALIALLGSGITVALFLVTRSGALARAERDENIEQLRITKISRELLNEQLEEHRNKLNQLISQMPGVVWEVHGTADSSLKLTFISDYVETMLGYSVKDWLETPDFWVSVTHPSDRDSVKREIAQIFQHGTGGAKFRWIAKDGREVWVETHAAVLFDERHAPYGMRGVTMDVTAHKRAEERLRDREVRLQFALAAARMASWHWDLISGTLMWDDAPYTWADFVKRVHPDDQISVRNALNEALRDRRELDFEFRVVQSDTSIRWLTLKARVFQGQDGRPAYITGVLVDVTERRKSAEALRASEERYRLAARATNDAIWDLDLTTGRVQWNEGIRNLFGYTSDQVGTDIIWRFNQIHPDDRERVLSGFNAVIEGGGRFWADEFRFRCANGSYAIVSDRAYIEQNESGKAVRLIAAMTDVTRLKQAEREREQLLRLEHTARKQAESANRVKDEFIATLSHELRTPLTPILGWTQLLRNRSSDPSAVQRGLDVIEHNARSQAKLIDDLLDLSRIVTGKMQVKMQSTEVQQIIQAAVDAVQPAADGKGVRIEIQSERPIQFTADPDRIQQVLWNLLTNAIRFTPSGGLISVSAEQGANEVRLVVRDTGEGIEPDFLPQVFDRFSQADSTNVRTHGGLGIGLAIVRYIVELHGGSVGVESLGKGYGATFTVTLPMKIAEARTRARKAKRQTKGTLTLKGLRLLVVDDDPDVRELLALVLQQDGALVTTAASSREALDAIETVSPDILISDIAMPQENGYQLLKKVREMERTQGRHPVPAIALSAYVREEDVNNSLQAGFEMHLSKPVDADKLIAAIIAVATRYLGKAS